MGSAAWTIAVENPTSRLRGPTQSLGVITSAASACIWSFSLPYAVNPNEGNLGGKIAFLFAGVMVPVVVFTYFFIPETKNRSYAEIEELWVSRTPARKWSSTKQVSAEEASMKQ